MIDECKNSFFFLISSASLKFGQACSKMYITNVTLMGVSKPLGFLCIYVHVPFLVLHKESFLHLSTRVIVCRPCKIHLYEVMIYSFSDNRKFCKLHFQEMPYSSTVTVKVQLQVLRNFRFKVFPLRSHSSPKLSGCPCKLVASTVEIWCNQDSLSLKLS